MAFLAAELLYVLAINVFLSTPLFAKVIDGDPLVVDIHYARAWSLFPQHIHAKGLSIRATDSHVEWMLKVDQVEFNVSLLQLAKKTFHVTRVRGEGVSFRLRMKVDAPAETERYDELRPPIDGLTELSIKPDEAPYAGTWDDKAWNLWTVQLDDTVAERVREIWIGEGRFAGDARIAGSFLLKPIRAVRLGPIHVDVRPDGVAEFAKEPFARSLAGMVDIELEKIDPRTTELDGLLHHATLSTELRGALVDVARLPLTLPEGMSIRGEVELRRIAPKIDHGKLADGSAIELGAESLSAEVEHHALRAAMSLRADVARDALAVRLDVENAHVDKAASMERLDVQMDSSRLDLTSEPLADLHAVADLTGARVPDLGALAALLPKEWSALRGGARAEAHAEAWRATKRVTGRAHLDFENAGAHSNDLDLSALRLLVDARGEANLESRIAEGGVEARADVVNLAKGDDAVLVHELSLHAASRHVTEAAPLDGLRVDAVAGRARITSGALHATSDVEASADIVSFDSVRQRLSLRSAKATVTKVSGVIGDGDIPDFTVDRFEVQASVPSFDIAHPSLAGVDAALHLHRAELRDARALNRFVPSGSLFEIESGAAVVTADATTSSTTSARAGHLDAVLTRTGVRLHDEHLVGDFTASVHLRQLGPSAEGVDLGGSTVAMRDVRVTGTSADTKGWGGELVVQRGYGRLGAHPRIDGDMTLEATDARPILALLLGTNLPGFIVGMIDMPELAAAAHLRLEPDLMVLKDASANGDNLSLRGVYVVNGAARRGAFVAQKGALSAGLRIDDAGTHVRFFGLNDWFAEQRRGAMDLACSASVAENEACDSPAP